MGETVTIRNFDGSIVYAFVNDELVAAPGWCAPSETDSLHERETIYFDVPCAVEPEPTWVGDQHPFDRVWFEYHYNLIAEARSVTQLDSHLILG